MPDKIIPANVRLAAKRGFVRTSYQSLAATIPTGGITGAALSGGDPVVIGWSVGAGVLSSVLAGLVSYLQIASSGIPEDYAPAAIPDGDGAQVIIDVMPRDPGPGGYEPRHRADG